MFEVFTPKYNRLGEGFSRIEQIEALEHQGRRTSLKGYQSPAAWISDLSQTKKIICLCSYCRVKFNHRKHHYRKGFIPGAGGDGSAAKGPCDGCKQRMENCGGGTWFTHELIYQQTCVDPSESRRKARALAGQKSVWRAINS